MKIVQLQRRKNENWQHLTPSQELKKPLVLVFGNRFLLEDSNIYTEMQLMFPEGHFVFGSTSGDILADTVTDEALTITAIEFEKTEFTIKTSNVKDFDDNSYKAGENLVKQFSFKGLKHIFVISDGSFINGSELTKAMNDVVKNKVLITGGLCGDGPRFEKTLSSYNENPKIGEIIAIGFYGESFKTSFSIRGGWIPFGPERTVTKSKSNKLYELDHKPALDLYKKYLGDKSEKLPGAALLYPLNVKSEKEKQSYVRTILNIDEDKNAMILAGDIPEHSKVQLMMTNIDNIANASVEAARKALYNLQSKPQLALLVSCIGRKLVLDQRVEEEIEEITEVLGEDTTMCGFYSYGEIAPFTGEQNCQLHNQTMTITLISE